MGFVFCKGFNGFVFSRLFNGDFWLFGIAFFQQGTACKHFCGYKCNQCMQILVGNKRSSARYDISIFPFITFLQRAIIE